jgi:hypothetical protein
VDAKDGKIVSVQTESPRDQGKRSCRRRIKEVKDAAGLSRVKVRQKRLALPSRDEFQINAESLRVATTAKARN